METSFALAQLPLPKKPVSVVEFATHSSAAHCQGTDRTFQRARRLTADHILNRPLGTLCPHT